MTARPSRQRPDVRNARKPCRLGAMVRRRVQHLTPNATDVARRDIGSQSAQIKDQDQLGPDGSWLKTLTQRLWLSDAYSLLRLLRMGLLCRLWRIVSWNPLS